MSGTLVGKDKLLRRLNAIENGRPVLRTIQLRAVAEAKKRVPRATGHTARTIAPGALTSDFTIVTAAGAAAFLEFGTGLHGPRHKKYPIVPRKGSMLAWPKSGSGRRLSGRRRTSSGRLIFARKVMHPGIKPQPFLVPGAIEAIRSVGIESIINEWNRAA
jgi:hypothetical protein